MSGPNHNQADPPMSAAEKAERREAVIQGMVGRLRAWSGLQPCCGTTNRHCSLPPGAVWVTLTGCENCGHPRACHSWDDAGVSR